MFVSEIRLWVLPTMAAFNSDDFFQRYAYTTFNDGPPYPTNLVAYYLFPIGMSMPTTPSSPNWYVYKTNYVTGGNPLMMISRYHTSGCDE